MLAKSSFKAFLLIVHLAMYWNQQDEEMEESEQAWTKASDRGSCGTFEGRVKRPAQRPKGHH